MMKMRQILFRFIFLIFLFTANLFLLSGCSLMSPVPAHSQSAYVIDSVPSNVPKRSTQAMTMLVMQPNALAAYDTDNMAYTIKPYEISYFSQNRWAETPAQMLQPLIVQALQNTHYFNAVVSPPFAGNYQYMLNIRILKLQQNFLYKPAVLQLVVRVQLIKVGSNAVIATKLFSLREPIVEQTPYGGVLAANKATEKWLRELAQFCVENIGASR